MKDSFIKLFSLIFALGLLQGCLSTIDRSRLNSKVMDANEFKVIDNVSPHTGLLSGRGNGGGGCSTCAK